MVTVVFCFIISMIALYYAVVEKYIVTFVALILCCFFVVIVLAIKRVLKGKIG